MQQFERGVTVTGHPVFHKEMPEAIVRAVAFFSGRYLGGADLIDVRKRWDAITN